jgi:glycosyltransferase involved in cell wall biosynthesis
MRVAINCEVAPDTQAGGTQSVTAGLVQALRNLDGSEEYLLITHPENRAWVAPYATDRIQLVDRPQPRALSKVGRWARRLTTRWRHRAGEPPRAWPAVPRSRGIYDSLRADAIHWPCQEFVVTNIPSIYNPHDLQHLHFPQFFEPREIVAREAVYPVACRLAHTVAVASEWTRDEFVQRYGLHPSRVQIVPWGPPAHAAVDPLTPAAVQEKFQLPDDFALYPAVTWEHKNHLRLLAALAQLRDRGLAVRLVCTGHLYERHWRKVAAEMNRLKLEQQVQFLGQVSLSELHALLGTAQFAVVPTLFESSSLPVFDAWHADLPVTCSTVTSLPTQVADAALLFDPFKVDAIAGAVEKMATDRNLRERLRTAGRRRLLDFPWERTARAFRALYKRAAHRPLDREERDLLQWDWMKERRGTVSRGEPSPAI